MHATIVDQLAALARVILQGDAIMDRALCEAVIKLIGSMVALYDEHTPDGRGHCPTCGRRRTCPVRGVTAYLTPPPTTPRRPTPS
jgi:hypothetical protein